MKKIMFFIMLVILVSFVQAETIVYNYQTNTIISTEEMRHILYWTDFSYYIAIDSNDPTSNISLFAVDVIWERQNMRKDVCTVGDLLTKYPSLIDAFPELEADHYTCHSGAHHGGALPVDNTQNQVPEFSPIGLGIILVGSLIFIGKMTIMNPPGSKPKKHFRVKTQTVIQGEDHGQK